MSTTLLKVEQFSATVLKFDFKGPVSAPALFAALKTERQPGQTSVRLWMLVLTPSIGRAPGLL